jgi:hypothetical protein
MAEARIAHEYVARSSIYARTDCVMSLGDGM